MEEVTTSGHGAEPSGVHADHKAVRRHRLREWVASHRSRTIVAVGLIVIAPTAVWAYTEATKTYPVAPAPVVASKPKPVKPSTKPSPLTGIEIAPELAERPVRAVVIENHPEARPQSGLSQAGIVYEALAEGGITRFLAFFGDERPAQIGPVRSLRTYFVDWTLEFDAPIAHVGGNADAIDMIAPQGVKSLNQFFNGGSYYRTRDRRAPHNAYTDSDKLDALLAQKGYAASNFMQNARKRDEPNTTPPHGLIQIQYSYNGYQVEYRYDAATNTYLRFLAGSPHVDRNTGQQIRVKNIVIEVMSTSYGKSRLGESNVRMGTPGSGRAIVLRDGGAVEGTWSKANHRERTKLLDAAGKEIALNPGNTWFSIVPEGKPFSF